MEASAESEMECKKKGTSAFGVAKKKRERGHASSLSQKTHLRLCRHKEHQHGRGDKQKLCGCSFERHRHGERNEGGGWCGRARKETQKEGQLEE
jgi:hypothetical protein